MSNCVKLGSNISYKLMDDEVIYEGVVTKLFDDSLFMTHRRVKLDTGECALVANIVRKCDIISIKA